MLLSPVKWRTKKTPLPLLSHLCCSYILETRPIHLSWICYNQISDCFCFLKHSFNMFKYFLTRSHPDLIGHLKIEWRNYCCFSSLGQLQCLPKYTNLTDAGTGGVTYLDRHLVDCAANQRAITRFQLSSQHPQPPATNYMVRYAYSCCKLPDAVCSSDQQTLTTDAKPYLDQSLSLKLHNVSCGNNGVLTQFKLVRNISTIAYEYKCCQALPSQSLSCYSKATQLNGSGPKTIIYLDRHNVKCLNGYFMNSFILVVTGDQMSYHYRCCKF